MLQNKPVILTLVCETIRQKKEWILHTAVAAAELLLL